jgi:ABC-type nickel/cobalt efflux system permease component RcnA
MLGFIVDIQRDIRGALSDDIAAFAASGDWSSLLAVLPLGTVFGAAHALTPGHSKSVLAAYVAGSGLTRLRASRGRE